MIAEQDLKPEAIQAVKTLLRDKSLGDIASWADEIRDSSASGLLSSARLHSAGYGFWMPAVRRPWRWV